MHSGFMVKGDIAAHNNPPMYVKGNNVNLSHIFNSVSIDLIPLPLYSLDLNPIKLVFNAMVQWHACEFINHNI